ncbi:GNAT family N-acetyltransferase [Pseudozobellia thermophila]|uniref:Ribosomal-protein-alanine N-acetyltransferase n=1 Tax=Pseudozobellia thermophila TaxID=192903 RepID=A0A1M6BYI3_9FLAO|nr:GNAT family N-acetyltransferase [Pseudozobellia thermophila]SHI53584.1 ribosomal-protein-alanine N-acetyltransferase [Pseudozobellia thermophila]
MQNEAFILQRLRPEDAKSLSELMVSNQGRFQRFFPVTLAQNLDIEASKAYISQKNKAFDSHLEYTFAIKGKTDDRVCGLAILKDIDRQDQVGEVAYCMDQAHTGRGWATRAVMELSRHAFEKLNLTSLKILVHESNVASRRVAEKSGFSFTKALKAAYTPPHEKPLDMLLFQLSKDR